MDQNNPNQSDTGVDTVSPDQIQSMKLAVIDNAKKFAMKGSKTIKNSSSDPNDQAHSYDWWENEKSFDGDFWSVSFWNYPDNRWQIQATKIALSDNGKSLMTSFSVRMNDDQSFPGFQVYEESIDTSYRPLKVEELVLLDRVIKGLIS
jgi:hypothetical protein